MTGCSQLPWCSAACRSCPSLLSGRGCALTPGYLWVWAYVPAQGRRKHNSLVFNTNKCWRSGNLILCTTVFKLEFLCFLQQPSQISLASIVITLSIKTLKLRSGIHWAVTALIKKTEALVSTCLFGKVCDCFGWCTKQTQYYFIYITVQELIKRCRQTPNCDFLKRCIFRKASLPICISVLKVSVPFVCH